MSGSVVRCPVCRYELGGLGTERCPECGVEIDHGLIEQISEGRALSITRVWLFYGLLGWVPVAVLAVIYGGLLISMKLDEHPFANVRSDWFMVGGVAWLLLVPVPVLGLWHRRALSLVYSGAIRRPGRKPRVLVRALALGVLGAALGALSTAILVLMLIMLFV